MAELKDEREIPSHRVSVKMGYTMQPRDFESFRMDVGLEIDNLPGEDPNKTFERTTNWVEAKLVEEFTKMKEELYGKGKPGGK